MSEVDLFDLCQDFVAVAAVQVARQYRGFVDADDVSQELWARVYGTNFRTGEPWEYQIRAWLEAEDDKDRKGGQWRLGRWLYRAGQRYARKQKATSLGYDVEDEFFYNKGMIVELLRAYWQDIPIAGERSEVRSPSDPAEGGNVMAFLSDIERALRVLDRDEHELLYLRHGSDMSGAEAAEVLDIPVSTLYAREERYVRKISDFLGGVSPYVD